MIAARAARLRGACASLLCLRMMSIFPSEDGGQRAAAEPRVKLPLESAQPPALVGFYSVYDDLASEDALASMADGGPTASIFSATMVLRADGQTSRGSEFPGGSWAAAERDGRVRLSMTLRAGRARAEERRYDGLVLEFEAPPDFDDDGEAPPPPAMKLPRELWTLVLAQVPFDAFEEEVVGVPCAACASPRALQRCGACKLVVYCSRECQAKHWKSHREACAQFRRAKAPVPVFPS